MERSGDGREMDVEQGFGEFSKDLKIAVLEQLEVRERLKMRLLDRSWNEAYGEMQRWTELPLKTVDEKDTKALERVMSMSRPKKIIVSQSLLNKELLAVLADCDSVEELEFKFCRLDNEALIMNLVGKEGEQKLKTINFVGNRLYSRNLLGNLMDSRKGLLQLSSRTEPKDPSEVFWGASNRAWMCTRERIGDSPTFTFSKSGVVQSRS